MPDVLCAGCGARVQPAKFCPECTGEMVPPEDFAVARVLRAGGVDLFELKKRVDALDPEQKSAMQARWEKAWAQLAPIVEERRHLQESIGVSLDMQAFEDAMRLLPPRTLEAPIEHAHLEAVQRALEGRATEEDLKLTRSLAGEDNLPALCALALYPDRRYRIETKPAEALRDHPSLGTHARLLLGEAPEYDGPNALLFLRCALARDDEDALARALPNEEAIVWLAKHASRHVLPMLASARSLVLRHLPEPAPEWLKEPLLLIIETCGEADERERAVWRLGGLLDDTELARVIAVAVKERDGRMFNAMLAAQPHFDAPPIVRAIVMHDCFDLPWTKDAVGSAYERIGDLAQYLPLATSEGAKAGLLRLGRSKDADVPDLAIDWAFTPHGEDVHTAAAVWFERKVDFARVVSATGSLFTLLERLIVLFPQRDVMKATCFYDWLTGVLSDLQGSGLSQSAYRAYVSAALVAQANEDYWSYLRGAIAKTIWSLLAANDEQKAWTVAQIEALGGPRDYWLQRILDENAAS